MKETNQYKVCNGTHIGNGGTYGYNLPPCTYKLGTEAINKAHELVKSLAERRFFGRITINLNDGKIVNCEVSESIKL